VAYRDNSIKTLEQNLFVNILTSLKTTSDIKWVLKSLNTEQLSFTSGYKYLSNYQKRKLLEKNIKLTIQEVIIIKFII
jgi:hypothetical protein